MKIINSCQCDIINEIKRFKSIIGPTDDEVNTVKQIIADVIKKGDEALSYYLNKFDGVSILPENFRIKPLEIESAYSSLSPKLISALRNAKSNIEAFQNHIKIDNPAPFGIDATSSINTEYKPIACVGVYIPGGSASYPSSVLMNAIPARIAGVKRIVMVSPPGKDGNIPPERLVAANESGVDEIYKIGGAQAIAALAFGTETIPTVDKIVGPGNIFVAIAKKEVFGHVGIDMIAGPSEVLIIADNNANPRFVAYDMVSQAEHDPGVAILVTSSSGLIESVQLEIKGIIEKSKRSTAIKNSLDRFGLIIKTRNNEEIVLVANEFAPEHLQIMIKQPEDILPGIKNAGAIFVGGYTPVALGDYIAGPSHVLPTGGTARFSSGLSVNDFLKRSTTISFSENTFKKVAADTMEIAKSEGLYAHADSIKTRINNKDEN
ncbi:MAG: histidinol dehydrogenase [Candidatus Anammoxibacter sp.]